jgi:filamentous hemagglutinin family protein
MKMPHRAPARFVYHLIFGLSLFLAIPCSFSLAQAVTPITSSGLNTHIGTPTTLPGGETVYDITGGTRPGSGPNLYHSFGDFNVPSHTIANFLNDSGLATSNILGRVTGGNISNIFGTIQTTGFGNANLFLMNPAGFLFGPTATVNVGGMMTFTSANYLKLADGVRFNAIPSASADLLLSTAPVAAFGFLGSNPGAITMQGSQLSVSGTSPYVIPNTSYGGLQGEAGGISLVGGKIAVTGGAVLNAPGGNVTLVSVGKPSHPTVGGEVSVAGTPTGFATMGKVTVSQGSVINVSNSLDDPDASIGTVVIRGGRFVLESATIAAYNTKGSGTNTPTTTVTVDSRGSLTLQDSQVTLGTETGRPGSVELTAGTRITLLNSSISAGSYFAGNVTLTAPTISIGGGGIDVNGYGGSAGTIRLDATHSVSLTDTALDALSFFGQGGTILINGGKSVTAQHTIMDAHGLDTGRAIQVRANTIVLTDSLLTTGASLNGGLITLDANKTTLTNSQILSTGGHGGTVLINGGAQFTSQQSTISAQSGGNGGTIHVDANKIRLTDTQLTTSTTGGPQTAGGSITVNAKNTTLTNSQILSSATEGHGGTISLTGENAVGLTHGTVLTADGLNGGTVLINGGAQFTSQQSTISAQSGNTVDGHGGTIHVDANKIRLTDTQLTTSTTGGPQTAGGSITVNAKNTTLTNSQILSTATEGHGGTIEITSPIFHQHAGSVIDASSQSGTNGTVIINGVIQP